MDVSTTPRDIEIWFGRLYLEKEQWRKAAEMLDAELTKWKSKPPKRAKENTLSDPVP